MTEKMPSSVRLGARPMIFWIRSYSSALSPCSTTTSGVIAGSAPIGLPVGGLFTPRLSSQDSDSREGLDDALEHGAAIGGAMQLLDRILWMGHQPQDILGLVEDAGDGAGRAVGIGFGREFALGIAIAEGDLAPLLEPIQGRLIGEVIAVVMGDGDREGLARGIGGGEETLAGFDLEADVLADEAEAGIAQQDAREQPRLGQDLEAVADA